jgi:hypothetical protein
VGSYIKFEARVRVISRGSWGISVNASVKRKMAEESGSRRYPVSLFDYFNTNHEFMTIKPYIPPEPPHLRTWKKMNYIRG